MHEEQVREIVRDEIAKIVDELGILPALTGFVTDSLNGVFGMFDVLGDAA